MSKLTHEVLQDRIKYLLSTDSPVPPYLVELSERDSREYYFNLQRMESMLRLRYRGLALTGIAKELCVSKQYVSKLLQEFDKWYSRTYIVN